MTVSLEEITDQNRAAVLALAAAPGQERFVSSVEDSLAAAADYPEARSWYRAVFAADEPGGPVGFVIMSWNCVPQPPEIIGPPAAAGGGPVSCLPASMTTEARLSCGSSCR
jgi:diamine N-acetyltransferase